eukprot:2602184-Prymnesium_polylepis.1
MTAKRRAGGVDSRVAVQGRPGAVLQTLSDGPPECSYRCNMQVQYAKPTRAGCGRLLIAPNSGQTLRRLSICARQSSFAAPLASFPPAAPPSTGRRL